MFEPHDLPNPVRRGSEARFKSRHVLFEDGLPHPHLRHYCLWLIHNCISHPLLGALPNERTAEFHQVSSNWLNRYWWGNAPINDVKAPKIPEGKRGWWVLHNVAAHMAIGVCPTRWTFAFHDWTAEKMGVAGWV